MGSAVCKAISPVMQHVQAMQSDSPLFDAFSGGVAVWPVNSTGDVVYLVDMIKRLQPIVYALYESGEHDSAEFLDGELDDLMDCLDALLFELDESDQQDIQPGESIDDECTLDNDLALRYYELFVDHNSYQYNYDITEKIETLRYVIGEYGGNASNVSDADVIAGAKDAYEYKMRLYRKPKAYLVDTAMRYLTPAHSITA